jgi:predicted RND superfamily exporter protein
MKERIEGSLRAYSRLAVDNPWLPLAVIFVLTALSLWRGTKIELDTDLKSLLPEDAPSVLAIDEARERRRGADLFVIAVESPEPLATVTFLDALAERLQTWEEIDTLDLTQSQEFFTEHILLYLPPDDLRQMDENLRRMIRERQGESNPLFIDLEREEGEPRTNWRNLDLWIHPLTLAELGMTRDEVIRLFPFFEDESAADAPTDDSATWTDEEREAERILQARRDLPEQYRDYRFSANARVAILTARLDGRPTDIEYARQVYEYAEGVIAELDPSSHHPEMRAMVVGSYQSFLEVRAVGRDVRKATILSLGLVFLLLVGFFRNVRSVLIVMIPLLVGIAWTLGLIELMYHRLSTLTAFVFSMLIGMGIDFGIHIYRRTQEEFHGGASWEDAIFASITRTGRALLTATLTTVGALLTLTLAHFDGFQEFGVACGVGVALCLVSALFVAPVIIGATEKLVPSKRRPPVRRESAAGGSEAPHRTPLLRVLGIGALAALVFAAVGFALSPQARFEYDFSNLEAPKGTNRVAYGSALGRNRSSSPAIVLGESPEQMREVHAVLRERLREGDPLLRGFLTIESVLPSEAQQAERMELIEEIAETLDRRAFRTMEGDERDMADRLRELTDVATFGADDLPDWARANLIERDGTFGAMGLIYGEYDTSDAREIDGFQRTYSSVDTPSGRVLVSSNGFVISDVVRYVQADGVRLALLVSLGILVILILDLRRPMGVIACLMTLAIAVGMTIGGMVLFDVKLGLYNMVVLPTVLGTGIDGAIHLYHRYLEEGRARMDEVMRTTGLAVLASSMTTAAGFFGLLLVEHKGVITIGALSVMGIVFTVIVCLTVLPSFLARWGRVP